MCQSKEHGVITLNIAMVRFAKKNIASLVFHGKMVILKLLCGFVLTLVKIGMSISHIGVKILMNLKDGRV